MEKLNIAEILKDCPKGMELDCALYDNVFFDGIDTNDDNFPISLYYKHNNIKNGFSVTKYGTYYNHQNAKCVIFPKGKTTWEGFVPPCQLEDGKIVATNNGLFIGIIKVKNNRQVGAYCSIDYSEDFRINSDYWFERMATEEEKAKLFDAIKEHGYKWNEETKTLEELVIPKFKVGDRVRYKDDTTVITITGIKDDYYFIQFYSPKKNDYQTERFSFKDQDKYELVPTKFDITTLKPFDKVLVRDSNKHIWCASIFSHTWKNLYYCAGLWHNQCIPYEGNEHLLGTTDNCDEFYKTWE